MANPSRLTALCFLPFACSSIIIQAQDTPPTPPTSQMRAKNGWNLYVQAEWLYWQANETGLGYALNQDSFNARVPEMMSVGETANPSFEWKSGFRGGLGYNTPHDEWDLSLLWTGYEGKAKDSQQSHMESTPTIFPSFIHPNAFNDEAIFSCFSANSDLTLHLNVLDLDLARTFKAGKSFSLRPHTGIRTAWLNQTYDVTYLDLYTYNLHRHSEKLVLDSYLTHIINNFWGIGIKGGFEMDWAIKWGLSLFSDFTAALLYGFFDTSYTESFAKESIGLEGVAISDRNNFHAGRAIADFQLGLKWNTSFAKERIKWVLQAGWEQHVFFSQNQIMRFVDSQSWGNFVQNQGDVYFQGFSASTSLFF